MACGLFLCASWCAAQPRRCTAQGARHGMPRRVMVAAYGCASPRRVSIGARVSALDSVRHIAARGLGRRAGACHGVPQNEKAQPIRAAL